MGIHSNDFLSATTQIGGTYGRYRDENKIVKARKSAAPKAVLENHEKSSTVRANDNGKIKTMKTRLTKHLPNIHKYRSAITGTSGNNAATSFGIASPILTKYDIENAVHDSRTAISATIPPHFDNKTSPRLEKLGSPCILSKLFDSPSNTPCACCAAVTSKWSENQVEAHANTTRNVAGMRPVVANA